MSTKQVWLITGAGRGMGLDITKAVLAAGHKVIATGRNKEKVEQAIGTSDNLLVVKLDVTKPEDSRNAVKTGIEKFGVIDVLVNNAANFYAGFFEELPQEMIEQQISTTLYGPMNVTREVLPIMRKQRSGKIITISSSAGLSGFPFCAAYSAAKFGIEGWMESIQLELLPFGIYTTLVEPGFFRTELLSPESTKYADASISEYNEGREQQKQLWNSFNGNQPGDPAKLAQALIKIASEQTPPFRFIAGVDAIAGAEQKIASLQKQIQDYRELSSSLAY